MFTRARNIFLLLALLALLASCGTPSLPGIPHTPQATFSTLPTGTDNEPEQGTDGKPRPLPNGH